MACLTTMFSIPTMAAVAMPRRTFTVVAHANNPAKHRLPSHSADSPPIRHRAVMFGAAAVPAIKATGQPVQATPSSTSPVIGGWAPIDDVHDSYVQELGEWAVKEYNKENGEKLEFCEVVGGEKQIILGTNYRLLVTTIGRKLPYLAEVYVSLDGDRKLNDFRPLLDGSVQATPSSTTLELGGWVSIDVHNAYVQELGKWAVIEVNEENDVKLEFCEVISGEKQIVSGTNYRLLITTVGHKLPYSAEVYVSLDGDWKLIEFKSLLGGPVHATPSSTTLELGGWAPIDVHDDYVQELGKWAVTTLNEENGVKLEFCKVISGEKQIVSGTNYRLLLTTVGRKLPYSTEVYVSLHGDRKLIDFTPLLAQPVQATFSSTAPGGWAPINVHDAYVQELGKWAVAEYNEESGEKLEFCEVVSGEKQIVLGTNYRLLITIVGRKLRYSTEVYVSLDGDVKLIDFNPLLTLPVQATASSTTPEFGGWAPIDVHDAFVQELGKWVITEYNKENGEKLEFSEVVSAAKQIVSGTNYRLVLTVVGRKLPYSAEVYVQLDGERKLMDFKPLLG